MNYIFYLASGNSKRFSGTNKLLFDFHGKPLFRHGLEALQSAISGRDDCKPIVVSRYAEILDYARENNLCTVYSEQSIHGLSYSIKDALQSVKSITDKDFMLFMVADQPFLRCETINRLLESITDDTEIISLCHEGRSGNPKIFNGKFAHELCTLKGDEGGKEILSRHRTHKIQVASSMELLDIDVQDYLSHITNIFITGGVKVGKTALIRRVLMNCKLSYRGYITVPHETYKEGSTYIMLDTKTEHFTPISSYECGLFKSVEHSFENFGVRCIKESLDSSSSHLVFDEIGRFEKQCTGFLQMLEHAFDSKKIVIGVLKKEELSHLIEFKSRKDCVVLDLDEMSIKEAEQQLEFLLRMLRCE